MSEHRWTGCLSDPYHHPGEYVRYCAVCGMEDTCEDPLPPCPGPKMQMAEVTYTTPDGVKHKEIVNLGLLPIIGIDSVMVGDIKIPSENIRLFMEGEE